MKYRGGGKKGVGKMVGYIDGMKGRKDGRQNGRSERRMGGTTDFKKVCKRLKWTKDVGKEGKKEG